eukprot:Nitzschia sp. Nitz4//scaffold175_size95217//74660//75868//NITZ4_004733-RA/size95217-augustus-gene-0.21-mRNA-1//1//CDS//3329538969//3496//frame0
MSVCTHPNNHNLSANLSVLMEAVSHRTGQQVAPTSTDESSTTTKHKYQQLPLNGKAPEKPRQVDLPTVANPSPPAHPASDSYIEQAHAALLRQLLGGQPATVSATPAMESAAADVNRLLQTLLASAMVSNCAQQPNQPAVTMDLLRLAGNTQPPPPPPQAVETTVARPVTTHESSTTSSSPQKDIPGLQRVSCRARGMPPDHCSESAYLWIQPGLAHGADLLCSYPACRASGVKFRYCKFCNVPAAKRSFLFRHGHTRQCAPCGSPHSSSDTEVSVSDDPKKKSISTTSQKPTEMVSDDSSLEQGKSFSLPNSKKRRASSQDPEDAGRKEAWRKLLYERPEDSDEDAMSKWLLRVMQTSRSMKKGG